MTERAARGGGGTTLGGRVEIRNRRAGGLWWRLPCALLLWSLVAAPVIAALIALAVLREYAADLPAVRVRRGEDAHPVAWRHPFQSAGTLTPGFKALQCGKAHL